MQLKLGDQEYYGVQYFISSINIILKFRKDFDIKQIKQSLFKTRSLTIKMVLLGVV